MTYTVTKSNGVDQIFVPDATIHTADTSVGLLGQNVTNYGGAVATSTVHMLENFANTAEPSNPLEGQIWFDTDSANPGESTGNLKVNVTGLSGAAAWRRVAQFTTAGHLVPLTHNTSDLGTTTNRWRAAYAVTFEAGGADLAERYLADATYGEGTVVKIGGEKEITQTTEEADHDVFGVVSLRPGMGLNSGSEDDIEVRPYIAIAGRIPVRVIGKVRKGQRLITSNIPGVAVGAETNEISAFAVIGRALEAKDTEEEQTVLSVVGGK